MITRRFSKIQKIDQSKLKTFRYLSTNKVVPNDTTNWGANLLTHTWSSSTGEGILTFDNPITNIPYSAFQGMTGKGYNLQAITYIPESCKIINNRAFQSNNTLLNVDFGDGVTTIGRFMFNGCRNINTVRFGKNVKYICNIDIATDNFNAYTTQTNNASGFFGLCFKLSTIYWDCVDCNDFMNSDETLFHHDSMLGEVYLDYDVEVTTVHLGRQIINIPRMCFYGCEKLNSVIDIPNTCNRIGDYAFADCKALTKVYCRAQVPPKIEPGYGLTEFDNGTNVVFKYYDAASQTYKVISGLKIFVPRGCANAYKTDPQWKEYANYIQEYYDYVDLGLRNSAGQKVLFATCNVGAKTPEEFGWVFGWGDSTGYTCSEYENIELGDNEALNLSNPFDWDSYKYSSDASGTSMTKYNATDKKTLLDPGDDAAACHMLDDSWKMPTKAEFELLKDTTKITREWIDIDGNVVAPTTQLKNILGIRLTSKVPGYVGNTLFFPLGGTAIPDEDNPGKGKIYNIYCAGSFWCKDLTTNVKKANFAYFYTPRTFTGSNGERYRGRHIRGVLVK